MRFLRCCLMLAAIPLAAQVRVDARLEQKSYIVGEPVYAVVEVTNIGDVSVSYSQCFANVALTAPEEKRKVSPRLGGCFVGVGFGGSIGCGFDTPPLAPGKTVSSRYLLRGYRLEAGDYELRVAGESGARDALGHAFDLTLKLVVGPGDPESLRRAFEKIDDRRAIIEMAPPFLESKIAAFARRPDTTAIAALGEMNTYASRMDLRDMMTSATDPQVRSAIVQALAATGERDNLEFFASLLRDGEPGTAGDYAAYGIAYIGGDDASEALRNAPARDAVTRALGNTKSPRAVPLLIGRLTTDNRDAVCSALITLTHHQWCDAPATTWASWWRTHESTATIYGPDQCPNMASPLAPLQ